MLRAMDAVPNPRDAITLRDYRPGDANAMYALDLECFEAPFRFTSRAMRQFAEEPHAIVLLAEAHVSKNLPPRLAGFAIAHKEGQTAYVVTLDVAPPYRRRGLARRLMEDTESRARATGAQEIALHVYTGNLGAIAFYEALGYNRMRMAENFYARGAHGLVYRKKL
jgi:[ribosomal protein S18]-alanine N-acetyltransferase